MTIILKVHQRYQVKIDDNVLFIANKLAVCISCYENYLQLYLDHVKISSQSHNVIFTCIGIIYRSLCVKAAVYQKPHLRTKLIF